MRSRALKPGRHSDGGGLYLNVKPAGSKSWLFMWVAAGKRREMGLGAYPEVGLAKARKLAAEHREAIAAGRDPIAERQTVPDAQLAVGMEVEAMAWEGPFPGALITTDELVDGVLDDADADWQRFDAADVGAGLIALACPH